MSLFRISACFIWLHRHSQCSLYVSIECRGIVVETGNNSLSLFPLSKHGNRKNLILERREGKLTLVSVDTLVQVPLSFSCLLQVLHTHFDERNEEGIYIYICLCYMYQSIEERDGRKYMSGWLILLFGRKCSYFCTAHFDLSFNISSPTFVLTFLWPSLCY